MTPSRKIGLAPGTLVHTGAKKVDRQHIRITEYDSATYRDITDASLEDVGRAPADASLIRWIRITGLHDVGLISAIGELIKVHPLVLEDVVNTGQRTKAEQYDDAIFVVFRQYHESEIGHAIISEQVSFLLAGNTLVSFHESDHGAFDVIYERIQDPNSRFRNYGSDYLAYALIDIAVDQSMQIVEEHFDELEEIETRLFLKADSADYRRIHRIRRNLIHVKKSVSPLRDVLNTLQRVDAPFISDHVRLYLRDVHDHVTRVTENTEDMLAMGASLLDTYMAQSSLRMNEIIKVLTIMSTVFIPLTFLVGVYGMNFENMPELAWRWGYAAVWGVMTVSVLGMLYAFKRMKWF